MSTQRNNVTNTSALLRVGAEFRFSSGATSKAVALQNGFAPFGNIVDVTPAIQTKTVEHVSSNRGNPRKDREDVTQSQIQFKVKSDEFNVILQKVMLAGNAGTNFIQDSNVGENADVLGFSNAGRFAIGNWYDITVGGDRFRNLTGLTISGKTEGTDFVVDNLTGSIAFKTTQSTDLTPVVSNPAIVAGVKSFVGIKPGQVVKLTGYGRLMLFDQDGDNMVFADYQDFSCQVTLDTASAFNATSFGDLTFSVLVTEDVGNWLTRYGVSAVSVTT